MALDEELKEIWKRMEKRKNEMEKINTSMPTETPTTPKSAKIPTVPRPNQTPTVSKLIWTPQKPTTPQKPPSKIPTPSKPIWTPQKPVPPQKPPPKIPTPSKPAESPKKIPQPILDVFGTSSSSSANSMFGGMSASNSIFGSTMSASVSTSATISNPIDEEPIEEEEEEPIEEEEENSRPITPPKEVDKTPTISSKPPAEMPPTIPTKPPQIVNEPQHFRPITPNDQIIGSLWDDINRELEKYKEAKKSQIDPNLSPRSRYGTLESGGGGGGHTISSYRLQSMTMKRGVSGLNDSALSSTSNASFNDSKLPEKRQRSDSDSVGGGSGTKENMAVDEADGNGSTTSTTLTADQDYQMKRLREMINVQQDQIRQASRALAFCLQNDLFRGSKEEVDARRALLISTQRKAALLMEGERIVHSRSISNLNEPKGTLAFNSICVRLNREYVYNYIHHPAVTNRYHFIVLIKCGEQVFHTTLKSSEDCIKSGFIEFTHHITISGISPDFICQLEVYSLKSLTDGTAAGRSGHSKKGTWRRMVISTPLNAYTHTFTSNSTGNVPSNRPVGEINSGFSPIGKCTITRQLIGREKFSLIDTVYPLDGCLILNMETYPDQNSIQQCQHRSFLSLYQIISGMGSWNRYWCVLGNGEMNFWRYPEDEATKNPTAHLELAWCISQVTAVPQSTASFPNSMQLDVMEPPRVEGEHNEAIRMLFAADTPEERDYWIQGINQAIKNSNLWRSTKQQHSNIGGGTRFSAIQQQCQ